MDAQLEARAQDAIARARSLYNRGERHPALEAALSASSLFLDAAQAAAKANREKLKEQFKAAATFAEQIKASLSTDLALASASSLSEKPEQQQRQVTRPSTPLKRPKSCKETRCFSDLRLSKKEQAILLRSSKFGNSVFPPWEASAGKSSGTSASAAKFTDPSGFLKLSPDQEKYFAGWKRPSEIWGDEAILFRSSPSEYGRLSTDLCQDVLSDCSIVASLCAASHWECLSERDLVSDILYPIEPGKYAVKLFINGAYRKVIIDDFLPTSHSSRYIHVTSRAYPSLYSPALIEKAYLKAMGGYDFPGSNAASDIFALTTWIPEHILLHNGSIDTAALWDRLITAWRFRDLLVTVGTGKLTDEEAVLFGLISDHDYTVISMRVLESGQRVVCLKNPWRTTEDHVKPSGISVDDCEEKWAADNCFWMDFARMCTRFNSMYLNWSPVLFKYRQQKHFEWDLTNSMGHKSLLSNPQMSIENSSAEQSQVWLLLARHITKDQPSTYIALQVFNDPGTKVWMKKNTVAQTNLVDSTQTLLRVDIPAKTRYSVVVAAESERRTRTSFSLFAYSLNPIALDTAAEVLPYSVDVDGQWTELTAGGNTASPSYLYNPQYKLVVSEDSMVQMFIETTSDVSVYAQIVWGGGKRVSVVRSRDTVLDTGQYEVECALTKRKQVLKGEYTVIASLYEPGVTGEFSLHIKSEFACQITRLPDLRAG
ncbi:hypothetical protein BZA70DRAFT_286577 [Myxozyma melibiosi]|uniref:Cysteine protease RIM13 n=1 Tax=Myxozyma melibiosi TaxID=54550 RepID=A0ABR1FBH8_9ASCO